MVRLSWRMGLSAPCMGSADACRPTMHARRRSQRSYFLTAEQKKKAEQHMEELSKFYEKTHPSHY